ncbi:hypothetical protein Ancab_039537 [Ancistrocladus abbreviatus]
MYSNYKVHWKGKAHKDVVWTACRITAKEDFNQAMKEIKKLDSEAYSYLISVDPMQWSRHAFNPMVKSDQLVNNVSEFFNKYIMEARDKPILTIFECIRR